MKIFILEDDSNCEGVIDWLKGNHDVVKVVKNIEDAAYYLEYEGEYREYDKFIMDASLPGAVILHLDGTETKYNGALNGIDYMLDIFPNLGIELQANKVAILTAFAAYVKEYLGFKIEADSIRIIDKNDNRLKNNLQKFLEA